VNKKAFYYLENSNDLQNLKDQSLYNLTNLANKHRLSILFKDENVDVFEFLARSQAEASAIYFLKPILTRVVLPSKLVTQKNKTTGLIELISEKPLVNRQSERLLLQDFDIFINFPEQLKARLAPYIPHADFETDESAVLAQL
jgi:hypothetical protein